MSEWSMLLFIGTSAEVLSSTFLLYVVKYVLPGMYLQEVPVLG